MSKTKTKKDSRMKKERQRSGVLEGSKHMARSRRKRETRRPSGDKKRKKESLGPKGQEGISSTPRRRGDRANVRARKALVIQLKCQQDNAMTHPVHAHMVAETICKGSQRSSGIERGEECVKAATETIHQPTSKTLKGSQRRHRPRPLRRSCSRCPVLASLDEVRFFEGTQTTEKCERGKEGT